MALKYTGVADPYVYEGVAYRPGDVIPMPKDLALREAARTALHSFEEVPDAPAATKPAAKSAD